MERDLSEKLEDLAHLAGAMALAIGGGIDRGIIDDGGLGQCLLGFANHLHDRVVKLIPIKSEPGE